MIPGWGRSSWRVPGRRPKLSRSSASVIGPTRAWCSCGQAAGDATAGLPQLKHARIPIFYTPDKLARGLQSRLAYHTWRECRLAMALPPPPPRTAPQDAAIARALGLERPTLSESESKQLLAAWAWRVRVSTG